MSLLESLLSGLASSKSQPQIHPARSSLFSRLLGHLKLLIKGPQLAPVRVRPQNRISRRRRVNTIVALALVAAAGGAMAQRPIGIDVSDYQSASLNWNTLKNTYGIKFGWAKAMEATCASCGGANWPTFCANAKAAGIPIGPYHYARYDSNPGTNGAVLEANAFWNTVKSNVKADGLTLMPMLDVEASFTGQTQATLSLWVDTWCTTVSNAAAAAGLRLKPCIYTSSSKAATYMNSTVTKWNTDIANWPYAHATAATSAQGAANPPAGMTPWTSWQFWQYDDQNEAQAITTGDGDIFNGTYAQMTNSMLVTALGASITSQPANVSAIAGTNVAFNVSATGAGTLLYQWKFNGANISSATTSHYVINNVQTTNAGRFTVQVTDNVGSALSSVAYLAVQGPLTNEDGATTVAPTGMVNWWTADGNTKDIYGNLTATPAGNFSYAAGEIDLAFKFDGSTSYLSTGAASLPTPWTASMWVKRASGAGTSAILLGDGTNNFKLEQYSNTFNVGLTVLGVSDYKFSPAYTAPIGTWVHLAFVGTGSSTILYVNGAAYATLAVNVPLPRAYIGAAYITSSAKYVDYLSGSLDEIMTFNRVLTPTEINSIASAGSSGLVRAAQLVGSSSPAAGFYGLSLKGETGKTLTIYTSTDLSTWSIAATIGNSSGSTQWIDTHATNTPAKYYRVTSP